MATSRGREEVRAFIAKVPGLLMANVLPGAARAGAAVIADDARLKLGSRRAEEKGGVKVLVADAVKVRVNRKQGRVVARVGLEGPGSYVAWWLEYGTAPHLIRVSDDQRGGRTVGRINRQDKAAAADGRVGPGAALAIGGNFVSGTVQHPGATAINGGEGFLRSSLDMKEGDAIATAQAYINRNVTRAGISGSADGGGA